MPDSGPTSFKVPSATRDVEDSLSACRNAVLLSDETMKDVAALNRVILYEEDKAFSMGETVARMLEFYRKYVPF